MKKSLLMGTIYVGVMLLTRSAFLGAMEVEARNRLNDLPQNTLEIILNMSVSDTLNSLISEFQKEIEKVIRKDRAEPLQESMEYLDNITSLDQLFLLERVASAEARDKGQRPDFIRFLDKIIFKVLRECPLIEHNSEAESPGVELKYDIKELDEDKELTIFPYIQPQDKDSFTVFMNMPKLVKGLTAFYSRVEVDTGKEDGCTII